LQKNEPNGNYFLYIFFFFGVQSDVGTREMVGKHKYIII